MNVQAEYEFAIKIQEDYERDRKLALHPRLCGFLRRFMEAADSHVELEPFIVEGQALLEEIEDDGTQAKSYTS